MKTVPIGADGTFALTDVPSPSVYQIRVVKPGYATSIQRIDVGAGETRKGVQIVLRKGDGLQLPRSRNDRPGAVGFRFIPASFSVGRNPSGRAFADLRQRRAHAELERLLAADAGAHRRGQSLKALHDLRVPGCQIGLLANLLIEMIQAWFLARRVARNAFHRFRLRHNGQLPRALPHRLKIEAGEVVMRCSRRLLRRPEQQSADVTTINRRFGGHRSAGELDDRREQVDRARDGVAGRPGLIFVGHQASVGTRTPPSPGASLSTAERQGAASVRMISIGFIIALWSGSRALNVFVDTITIMYGMAGKRGIVRTRALSFALYVVSWSPESFCCR